MDEMSGFGPVSHVPEMAPDSHLEPTAQATMISTRHHALALLASLALSACSDATSASANPATADPSLDLVPAPLPGEYVWSQGQPGGMMPSTSSHVCFLTYIAGSLDRWEDSVAVVQKLGRWFLIGNSASPVRALAARARCIAAPSYTQEVSVIPVAKETNDLPATSGAACGLTRVGGRLNASYDRILLLAGHLRVIAVSGYVTARARCAHAPVVPVPPVLASWQFPIVAIPLAPTVLPPNAATLCVLAGLQGRFDGAGDWVQVYRGPVGVGQRWFLRGAPHPGIVGRATCMKR